MTDRNRVEYETLGVGDWVSREAAGLGEAVLLQDVEHRWANWQSLSYQITPMLGWGALSHLEASGFSSPGFAPIVVGAATAQIPAGTEQANGLYIAAATQASREGRSWEHIDDPWERVRAIRDDLRNQQRLAFEAGESPYPDTISWAPGQDPVGEIPEDDFSLWGAIKGTSRWGMLMLDVIPEGLDAIARGIVQVKQGNLSVPQAAAGLVGLDREASQLVGIPLFQYAGAAVRGERLNMGTGFFAEGEIDPAISAQMANYDAATEGRWDPTTEEFDTKPARELFRRLQEQHDGKVPVTGPGGTNHVASDFEEWQHLRRNAGRAALLATLQYSSSNQAALGQPFGTFGEILDEGTMAKLSGGPLLGGENKYMAVNVGRGLGGALFESDSTPFHIVSASTDLGKQLLDLPILQIAAKGPGLIVNTAKRFIGQGNEMGDLIRGSQTLKGVLTGSDLDALPRVFDDLGAQRINRDAATEALARTIDEPLTAAKTFLASARQNARVVINKRRQAEITSLIEDGIDPDVAANMAKSALSGNQIDALVRRAAGGEDAATRWLTNVMIEAPKATADDVSRAVQNLTEVTGRQGVDLFAGRFGTAVIDDALRSSARSRVDELADLVEGNRASFMVDRAKAVQDVDQGIMLTFDADIGRAQGTLQRLFNHIDDTATRVAEQKQAARALIRARNSLDGLSATSRKARAAELGISNLVEGARRAGLNPYDMDALGRAARHGAIRSPEAAKKGLVSQLFGEHWATQRWAESALGASDEAAAELRNLTRVLHRAGEATNLVDEVGSIKPRLAEGQIRRMLTGKGAGADMVESLRAAKTIDEIEAILHGTKEAMGRTIDPRLIHRLKIADTTEDIIQAIIDGGEAMRLVPQRIGLLGNYAKAGTFLTAGGAVTGGVLGGIEEGRGEEAGWGDVVGGVLSGAVIGGLVGSGAGGIVGTAGRGLTRSIDNVADAMDMMLAGTRSMTSDFLRLRGVPMGRAQAGLSAPTQLLYGMGHTAWGRRVARSHRPKVNINDPFDMYYTLSDMVRGFGVSKSDVVVVMTKGTGASRQTNRLLRSSFRTADEFTDAIAAARREGFEVFNRLDLDEAFSRIANLQANNTADGYRALEELFGGLENILVSKGLDPDLANFLTRFANETGDEFIGNVNAIGEGANYAQSMVLNGKIHDLSDAPLLMTEMWGGNIYLPRAEDVHRAVAQLDHLGKVVQTFTGAGVWGRKGSVAETLRKAFRHEDVDWAKLFDPKLEYNVAMRTARAITGTVWAPAVLLTRPVSFLSRVLGEDQARMTAANVDSLFRHPFNYLSAVAANWDFWKRIRPRGVAARSLIPSNIFDESGNLLDDGLANIDEWAQSERVRQGLGLYDRNAKAGQRFMGQSRWTTIRRGEVLYKKSMAGEFRQLVADPMVRRLAQSEADDAVEETLSWLIKTREGQRFHAEWAKQFDTPAEAARFGLDNPDNLRAFLHDQYARLQLKTGGEWVFRVESDGASALINSSGEWLSPQQLRQIGVNPDELKVGYNILRGGDEDMLAVVRTGRINDIRVSGGLDQRKFETIQEFVGRKHDSLEGKIRRAQDAGRDTWNMHRLPERVKGSRTEQDMVRSPSHFRELFTKWEDGLDRLYDAALGKPTNWFSRQPTLSNYYWERVGLMLPTMDELTANKFRALAKKEGYLRDINRIATEVEKTGIARGVLTNFDVADLNAKAYAVERTKDILFDLTRQRNFIDSMRISLPFAGPMVEALEAWSRVIRQAPVPIWRRGSQAVEHFWEGTPLDGPTPRSERGLFWRDTDGTEMVTIPFTGWIGDWAHENLSVPEWVPLAPEVRPGDVPPGPITARARGFNVVFGPDDLSDPEEPRFAGVPLAAFNPGQGPAFTWPAYALLKDGEGLKQEAYEFFFPYGPPDSAIESFMPYHLRTIAQGLQIHTSAESKRAFAVAVADQWAALVASGRVGRGDQYEFDISDPGGVELAMTEARQMASVFKWIEGFSRGSMPTMVTPEVYAQIPTLEANGVATERLMNISALQELGRRLFSTEGAEVLELENGTKISTEGDWEVVTDYMRSELGIETFNAELLNVSPSTTIYPRLYTESARVWTQAHESILDPTVDLRLTGHLLMPDFAMVEATEEFDPQAREAAIARGEVEYADIDGLTAEVESRLLSMRYAEIERQAIERFGPDDLLEGEAQDEKDVWEKVQKERAKGVYNRGIIPLSLNTQVTDELRAWDQRDWAKLAVDHNLGPEELATVSAMLWYLQHEKLATGYAQREGVTSLANKGSSATERATVSLAREELIEVVETQIRYSTENNHDLGNFPYLWERYLKPRLDVSEEDDPLADLAESLSPYGASLDILRSDDD